MKWLALVVLGAYHGVNPAMGWLFAVALGLQERRLSAVLRALIPIAIGHELSVAAVTLLVVGIEGIVAPTLVRVAGALVLIGFGIFKLLRPRAHPRWVGMRVSLLDLGANGGRASRQSGDWDRRARTVAPVRRPKKASSPCVSIE